MNESKQPFTDHVTKTKNSGGSRTAWIIAVVMAAVAAVMLGLWTSARTQFQQKTEAYQSDLEDVKADLAATVTMNQTNKAAVAALTSQIADLQKQKEQVTQSSKSLENEMRSELESKDVTISKLQGKLTVNILDRVMFDSGEAVLKPDGEAVMQKIAAILKEHPQLSIHVIGHTDNVPIRSNSQGKFASNWELSAARALAAVHFLTERAGVDPHRVGAVGYGEFRPVADNSTPEGRAKNRRIAVTILPDEFTAPDAPPAPKVNADTNAPPSGVTAN